MKKGVRVFIIVLVIVVVAGVGAYVFRDKILPRAGSQSSAGDPVGYSTTKVTRGELSLTVSASGQFEPNTITTIRPDANMPTRKLVKILVNQGQWVSAGQELADVDATGLDLNVESDQANFESQQAKLANVRAKPDNADLVAAEASLTQAQVNQASQQQTYDSDKALYDKGLASKSQLDDAQRQLLLATSNLNSAQISYDTVKAQSQADVIKAQEAAVAQADYDLQMAKIVLDSTIIRSPVAGVVAEVSVNVGDLVSPSTALMTVVNPDPMLMQALVNENDMENIEVGNPASVTPSGLPDLTLQGKVTDIDLHAQIQSNVSVFKTAIAVPNHDGKILWGMNADAVITVLDLKNVLMLPNNAIKQSNGSSTVTILDDGGKPMSWDVQTGVTDGSRTQILAGLDEGEDVLVQQSRAPTTTSGTSNARPQGPGMMFQVLR